MNRSSISAIEAQPAPSPVSSPTPAKGSDTDSGDIDSIYSRNSVLSYMGYDVERRSRKTSFGNPKLDSETQYAVLRKDGRVLATFDGLSHPLGTEVRFGLFQLLGQPPKQLIVEQTTHRGWRYWVVNLSPNFRIIYDSGDYSVGHSLRALDLDQDGRYELIHTLLSFWFFNKLTNINSPFIEIVFKYNPRAGKYIPASREFRDFTLKDIGEKIREEREVREKFDGSGYDGDLLGAVLEVTLRYIYAGKEGEGWSFFEQYDSPDKESVKSEIKRTLAGDTVYRTIKSAEHNSSFNRSPD